MSTRSLIALENPDGSLISIYCHWDGYPAHNGRILHDSYGTSKRVKQLVALGDLSSLGPDLGCKHDFENSNTEETRDMCTAYGRDRNDDGSEAKNHAGHAEFWDYAAESWCDYAYLFREGKWHYTSIGTLPAMWKELTPAAWEKQTEEA